jgi:imidazolonepropionase
VINPIQIFRKFNYYDSDFKNLKKNQAMIEQQGRILWIGPEPDLKRRLKLMSVEKNSAVEVEFKNQLVLPAFIECHTHTVFAGTRADEFELRNQGMSYLDIAKGGGGILSTMKKTRAASIHELEKKSQVYVDEFARQGVATLEIKSGYALDLKNEIKILKVIESLQNKNDLQIMSTYLGPHALPPEFKTYKAYMDYIIETVLPILKKRKLTRRVDIFIEQNFFNVDDGERYLKQARALGFDFTIHANQMSFSGAAELACRLKARSADHVIHLNEKGIRQFAKSQTVAVLLPAADLYMRCKYPPARKLIDAGAQVALATDFNPGSCPTQDLMLVGLLARLEMKMSLPEVFRAYTVGAARALGVHDLEGELVAGKKAQFIVTEADLTDFFYSAGKVPTHRLYLKSKKQNKTIDTGI